MRLLTLPPGFAFPGMVRTLADGDTMHAGSDEHYLSVGLSALRCIADALGSRQPRRILDLPSGFGRVTRLLRARYPDAAITACDLDRPGVDFAAAQFGARPAYSVEDFSRLRLEERFDLVWVGSLVTHLDEATTRAFLAAMARHMRPGGTLVASTHGPGITAQLHDWGYGLAPSEVAGLLDQYGRAGYGHRGYDGGDGYGISISDELWWRQATAAGPFRLVAHHAKAWDGHQDIVVLRRAISLPQSVARLTRPRDPARTDALALRQQASQCHDCLRSFDAYYLAENPDVARAVAAGDFTSAFQHYWRRGRFEDRRTHAVAVPPTASTPVAGIASALA